MIMSDRDQFTGTHLTPEVKEALRVFSKDHGKSMSKQIADFVEGGLKHHGVEIVKPTKTEDDRPLPFEGTEAR